MDIEDWVEGARTPLIRPEASRDVAIGSTRASNDLEAAHASHYGLPPSTDQAPPRPLYRDLLFALPPALLAMVQNLNSDLILQNFSVKAQVPTSTKALSQLVSGLLSAVLVVVLAAVVTSAREVAAVLVAALVLALTGPAVTASLSHSIPSPTQLSQRATWCVLQVSTSRSFADPLTRTPSLSYLLAVTGLLSSTAIPIAMSVRLAVALISSS